MRLKHFVVSIQLYFFLPLVIALAISCTRSSEEQPVMPPATHPLARDYVGYGVVNVSFTNLLSENSPDAVSQGYIRRGTVVRIIERAQVKNKGKIESWILGESNYQVSDNSSRGWLQESALLVFDSESKANTASKSMSQ
jgi:hypothetical protein